MDDIEALIKELDNAIDACNSRKSQCYLGSNRGKYDLIKDGLFFARGAAMKLLKHNENGKR